MIQSFTIDRSKWRTGGDIRNPAFIGTGKGITKLLNKEGYMCCLGFFCLAAGLREQDIANFGQPNECYFDPKVDLLPVAKKGYQEYEETGFCSNAININDNPKISIEEREGEIKNHFASVGISVEFTNEYIISTQS